MREKLLEVLKIYREGGTRRNAQKVAGMGTHDFYDTLRANPDLEELYYTIQKDKADDLVDEALEVSMDDVAEPKRARVQIDGKMKIAAVYDRKRFGQQVDLTLDQRISIAAPLAAAKARLRPLRDLGRATDAEVIEIPRLSDQRTSDKQSEVQVSTPRKLQVNPFD